MIISSDFKWKGDNIAALEILFKAKPTEKEVRKALKELQAKYREGSEYNTARFSHCTVYFSVFGWDSNWCAYFDMEGKYFERPATDEPTGKYSKPRYSFKL